MTKESVIEVLTSVAEESLIRYNARILGIFGSVARGDDNDNSDIDVLVDFTEKADLFNWMGLEIFLEEKFNRNAYVVSCDTIKSKIRDAVMKDTIYI